MAIVEALKTATAKISSDYFLPRIASMEHPIKRERVYCYELYHQLRLALAGTDLILTGEPDKKGHPTFANERQLNPDLIFHWPGSHLRNGSVVEVECTPTLRHLIKDFGNLKQMRGKGYQELVLLLFAVDTVPWPLLVQAAAANDIELSSIVLLLHSQAGREATVEHAPRECAA